MPELKTYKTKCVMLGRKPATTGSKYKTALIALFDKNNPHKTGTPARKVLEFTDVEKVRIRDMNVSYYLEGNDIVINDLHEINLEKIDNKIILRGKQDKVERREDVEP